MDIFTDRLAQRLQAQELIRANSAAEVEKLNNLQNEVKDYQECISQMRIILDAIRTEVERLRVAVSHTQTTPMNTFGQSGDTQQLLNEIRKLTVIERKSNDAEQILLEIRKLADQLTRPNDSQDPLLQSVASEQLLAEIQLLRDQLSHSTASDQLLAEIQSLRDQLSHSTASDQLLAEIQSLRDQLSHSTASDQLLAQIQTLAEQLTHSPSSEQVLEELHALNLRFAQPTDQEELLTQFTKLDADRQTLTDIKQTLEEFAAKITALSASGESGEQQAHILDEMQKRLEEHIHKENVKVYRNVQAVVVEETGKLFEANTESFRKMKKKISALLGMIITAMVIGFATLGGVAYLLLKTWEIL
ncbi:MAG: hypothetical protein LBM69_08285 [Lachnospiraceae bacterium]|jgi:hypothetical protein|nr:hypothetical protein [Lachnospiraceae bacterium]